VRVCARARVSSQLSLSLSNSIRSLPSRNPCSVVVPVLKPNRGICSRRYFLASSSSSLLLHPSPLLHLLFLIWPPSPSSPALPVALPCLSASLALTAGSGTGPVSSGRRRAEWAGSRRPPRTRSRGPSRARGRSGPWPGSRRGASPSTSCPHHLPRY
jgi:hypothetical protein